MRIKLLATATGLALAVTAAASAGAASADVQPYIVGGHAATVPTPWMASLQYTAPDYGITESRHTCGGSLVFSDWILTNAHCVTDPPEVATASGKAMYFSTSDRKVIPTKAKRFSVRIGSHDRTQGGETATVTRIVVIPGWDWGAPGAPKCKVQMRQLKNPVCDIAMLKLDRPVNSQTIQVAPRGAQPGDRLELFGWGDNTPDTTPTLPTQLQQLTTKVVAPARCAEAGQSSGEICTDNPNRTDGPGAGDSGGPAVKYVRGVPQLVGGASRAATPYPGAAPTVYTSSPFFRSWIYDTARGMPAGV